MSTVHTGCEFKIICQHGIRPLLTRGSTTYNILCVRHASWWITLDCWLIRVDTQHILALLGFFGSLRFCALNHSFSEEDSKWAQSQASRVEDVQVKVVFEQEARFLFFFFCESRCAFTRWYLPFRWINHGTLTGRSPLSGLCGAAQSLPSSSSSSVAHAMKVTGNSNAEEK